MSLPHSLTETQPSDNSLKLPETDSPRQRSGSFNQTNIQTNDTAIKIHSFNDMPQTAAILLTKPIESAVAMSKRGEVYV